MILPIARMTEAVLGLISRNPTKTINDFANHCGEGRKTGGQQIMTCSNDGSLGVWNLQTGERIANWQDGESAVNSIALSVDGRKVVSGSGDGVVRLWSMETGKVIAKWTGHTQLVWSVCWNQDGKRVLSGSWDGTARAWDVETGEAILEINAGQNYVYTATFSPASTLIATDGDSSEDERIKIWDANTGKLVAILKGHTAVVHCLAWTADGRTLISGSDDGTIRTWNTSTWQQLAVLTGHSNSVAGIAISQNSRILASASWDKTAQLWNLENGQPICSPLQHPEDVRCVSFSTDGKLLATGCHDKNAYTWDVSAIIKEAGLNELLDGEKSFLNADATRRPVQQLKNVRTIPTLFFAEAPSHPDPVIAHPISPPVVPEGACPIPLPAIPEDAPPEVQLSLPERSRPRYFKWLRRNTSALQTFLHRVRLSFFNRPQAHDNEAIEVLERPPSVVDVPLAHGLPRNYSAREARMKKEKEKEKARQAKLANKSKNMKNVATTSQSPTQGNVIQQSAGQSQAHPISEPHLDAFTPPAAPANGTPAPATVSATPAPATATLQAGCLTHFLCHISCVSAPHASGHY